MFDLCVMFNQCFPKQIVSVVETPGWIRLKDGKHMKSDKEVIDGNSDNVIAVTPKLALGFVIAACHLLVF